MEPRPRGRGNRGVEAARPTAEGASMEPRPRGRGNDCGQAIEWGPIVLQWSHVLEDVEIERMRPQPDHLVQLQWSHVLEDVEIC